MELIDTTYQLRWMIRRDMAAVLTIDRQTDDPWGESKIVEHLKQRNCIGIVCLDNAESIVGWMLYKLENHRLEVLRLAVHANHRRCGVGRAMLDRIKDKLSQQRRHEAWFDVCEYNLPAQLWLKACGWKCVETLASAGVEPDVLRFVVQSEK